VGPDAAPTRDRLPPLHDRCVVVTRAEEGADALAELLRERGARVLELPLIRLLPPHDPTALQHAVAQLSRYDWLVFTSANAVRAFRGALPRGSGAVVRPRRIAAVGSATARAVADELGWAVDAVPAAFTGDHVAVAMAAVSPLAGRSILWPRAAAARAVLRQDLEAAGARLDAPEAYRSEPLREAAAELARRVAAGEVDAITFTSPSAVRCYAETGAGTGAACVAVIGPTTAATARAAGLPVHVQPEEHTFPALVEELVRHLAGARGEAAAE
jgi:uroporphyrinogen III methyltransferase / synthase